MPERHRGKGETRGGEPKRHRYGLSAVTEIDPPPQSHPAHRSYQSGQGEGPAEGRVALPKGDEEGDLPKGVGSGPDPAIDGEEPDAGKGGLERAWRAWRHCCFRRCQEG